MKRIPLTRALERLCSLFSEWRLPTDQYVLVDEFSYVLQDYDVRATEVAGGHLDVYVNPQKLVWEDGHERSIIPPKDSLYMDNWLAFMQKTGYSLDMLRATPEIIQMPTVYFTLPSGRKIRLMRAYEMTETFVQQTLLHYSLEEVDKEKIVEWLNKLELIKSAAQKKNDKKLARLCSARLSEVKIKWKI